MNTFFHTFENWSLKKKLLGASLGIALMSFGVYLLSWSQNKQFIGSVEQFQTRDIPQLHQISDMRYTDSEISREYFQYIVDRPNTEEKRTASKLEFETSVANYEETSKKHQELEMSETYRKLDNERKEAWITYREKTQKLFSMILDQNITDSQVFAYWRDDVAPAKSRHTSALKASYNELNTETVNLMSELLVSAARTERIGLFLSFIVLGTIFGIGYFFSKKMSDSLGKVVHALFERSEALEKVARNIEKESSELSSTSIEQAAAIQETASSTDEINAMVSKNADNAVSSLKMSEHAKEVTQEGQVAVTNVLNAIMEIHHSSHDMLIQVENSNKELKEIVGVISEIGEKTKVINDIVFQTKLLSFNASVEAERAREHGKGFAVVAEEVGNLAQMSGVASKEITKTLSVGIQRVEDTVEDSQAKMSRLAKTVKEKVDQGTRLAEQCKKQLEEIVNNVGELNSLSTEFSSASQEQAQGINEVTKAMGQMDQVTQLNSQLAQRLSSASSSLLQEAQTVRTEIQALKGIIYGSGHGNNIHIETELTSNTNTRKQKDEKPLSKTKEKPLENTEPQMTFNKPILSTPEAELAHAETPITFANGSVPLADDQRFEEVA